LAHPIANLPKLWRPLSMALAETALLIRANEAGRGEERSDQAAQLPKMRDAARIAAGRKRALPIQDPGGV
jgi:hypothetical protein